jgi:hypothetical protein
MVIIDYGGNAHLTVFMIAICAISLTFNDNLRNF